MNPVIADSMPTENNDEDAVVHKLRDLLQALDDAAHVIHAIGLHYEHGFGDTYQRCGMSVCQKNLTAYREATR